MFELLRISSPLFLDRDQGNKVIPGFLQRTGLKVECHSKYYKDDLEDDIWIRDVSRKGWLIVSSDKGLENDVANKLAVIESKAKVFILEENGSRGEYWAAAIIVSWKTIYELAGDNPGPFYVNIQKDTGALVGKFRIPAAPDLNSSQPDLLPQHLKRKPKPDKGESI